MAKWFRAKSEFELLEKWVKRAFEKFPDSPVVQLEYAGWLLRTGKYDDVAKLVEKFESKNGATLDSSSLKGRIAFAKKQYDQSVKHFGEIFRQQPNNFENSSMLVFALSETPSPDNHQQAYNIAQRNFQAFPNNQLAALAMAVALKKFGKSDVADQLLERAARMGNIMADTAYFMAQKLNGEGRAIQAKIMLDGFLDAQDTFLYRERAKELIDSVSGENSSLPEPKGN